MTPKPTYKDLEKRIRILEAEIIKCQRIDELLRDNDLRFKKLSAHIPGIVYQLMRRPDGTYCIPFTTDAITHFFGCLPQDVAEDITAITRVIFPDDLDNVLGLIESSAASMTIYHCEFRVQIPGQPIRLMYGHATPEKMADGGIIWHGVIMDITDRKMIEEELRKSEEQNRALLDGMIDTVWVIDFDANLIDVNKAAVEQLGYSKEELLAIGLPGIDFSLKPNDIKTLASTMPSDELQIFETSHTAKNGRTIPVEVCSSLVTYRGKRAILSIARNITERKQMEEQIRHMANHDPLTALPTLRLANDRLDMAISEATRNNTMVAALFLDLDDFKEVNDTFGHSAGDSVLKQVALRMLDCVRKADTVARIGGDEFLVIASGIHAPKDAALVAEKIIRVVPQPIMIDTKQIVVGVSIGIALFPDHSEDKEQLLELADEAMYMIKKSGKNGYRFATARSPV